MVFVFAKEGTALAGDPTVKFTTQYFDEKGNMTVRGGGTKAWRNNNPGNLVHKPAGFAVRHGAIGKAGGMAVFPTEDIGRKALIDLLKSPNYINLKINEISDRYDYENREKHRAMLLSISKLDRNKRIKELSSEEFVKLRKAMERIEGWEIGNEDFIEKWYIAGVHKKRNIIYEYFIKKDADNRWISKTEALGLACNHYLHAVIVHLKNGTIFLRPEYGNKPFVES